MRIFFPYGLGYGFGQYKQKISTCGDYSILFVSAEPSVPDFFRRFN